MNKVVGRFSFTDVELQNGNAHRFMKNFVDFSVDVEGDWKESWKYDDLVSRWIVVVEVSAIEIS